MLVGVCTLEGDLLGLRENGLRDSGVDFGDGVALCTMSIGCDENARAGEGGAAISTESNGLESPVTYVAVTRSD